MPALRQFAPARHSIGPLQAAQPPTIGRAKLLQQIRQRVPELDHPLRGNRDLGAGAAPGDGLRDAQEPPAYILLEIEVVAAIVLDHHLRLEFAVVGQIVGIRRAEARVEVAERGQVVTELRGSRQSQEYLAATTISADLGEIMEFGN